MLGFVMHFTRSQGLLGGAYDQLNLPGHSDDRKGVSIGIAFSDGRKGVSIGIAFSDDRSLPLSQFD